MLGFVKTLINLYVWFGWVRTHLGDVFSGEHTSFLLILVGFMEKGTKSANLGNFGVLRHDIGIPRSSLSSRQGVACPRQGMDEREAGQASGTPRCSKATS